MKVSALVVVDVPCVGPLDVVKYDRLPTNRTESSDRAVDTTWQQCLGLLEDLQSNSATLFQT